MLALDLREQGHARADRPARLCERGRGSRARERRAGASGRHEDHPVAAVLVIQREQLDRIVDALAAGFEAVPFA